MTTIYVKNGTPLETQSKCASCLHAHIVRGYRESEELAYCTVTYGPPLVVPFKVYQCTSYLDRSRPTWKQMEELAIDILPLSSGKSAGFRKHDNCDPAVEDEEVSELETVNR
jgi:hypothetical protein